MSSNLCVDLLPTHIAILLETWPLSYKELLPCVLAAPPQQEWFCIALHMAF